MADGGLRGWAPNGRVDGTLDISLPHNPTPTNLVGGHLPAKREPTPLSSLPTERRVPFARADFPPVAGDGFREKHEFIVGGLHQVQD